MTLAPILISFSRRLLSDHGSATCGIASVRMKLPGEDGPSRFIAKGSMPSYPFPPIAGAHAGGKRRFLRRPWRKTCPRAMTASLDLRQRKPTIFRKPTGGVSDIGEENERGIDCRRQAHRQAYCAEGRGGPRDGRPSDTAWRACRGSASRNGAVRLCG